MGCQFVLAVTVFITVSTVSSLNIITADQELEKYLCGGKPITSHTLLKLSNNSIYLVRPGNFCVIRDLANISLVGPAVIQCIAPANTETPTGFGFWNVTNLSISDITFKGCGGVASDEFRNSFLFDAYFLQAAIVVDSCSYVRFSGVEIINYRGYAIFGVNVLNSTFERITIQQYNNSQQPGSGMAMYFSDRGFDADNSSGSSIRHFVTIREAIIKQNANLSLYHSFDEPFLSTFKQDHLLPSLPGNAGGLSINFLQLLYNIRVDIVNSEIVENVGSTAAGLKVLYQNTLNHADLSIRGCLFRNNTLLSRAGKGAGIQIVFDFVFEKLSTISQFTPGATALGEYNTEIRDTVVKDHRAPNGAGLSITSSPQNVSTIKVLIRNVSFTGNAAEGDGDSVFAQTERSVFLLEASLFLFLDQIRVDSKIEGRKRDRSSSSGALTFINLHGVFINGSQKSPTVIENGLDSAVTAFSTDIYLSGTVIFRNNEALIGAALNLQDTSYLLVTEKANASFYWNRAEIGGAIYIEPVSGPQCVLQIVTNNSLFNNSNIIRDPENLSLLTLNVRFVDNTAELGKSLFGGPLYNCTGFPDSIVQLPMSRVDAIYENLFSFENFSFRQEIRSTPVRLCLCSQQQNKDFKCLKNVTEQEATVPVIPGKQFALNIASVDGAGQPLQGTIVAKAMEGNLTAGNTSILTGKCQEIAYTIVDTEDTATQLELSLQGENIAISVNLTILPCPSGFSLSDITGGCDCAPVYQEEGITCNISTKLIQRSGWQWVGTVGSNGSEEAAFVSACPYGYCSFNFNIGVNISEPSAICQGRRTGVLCGQCEEGLSIMFGMTDCGECSSYYLFTILLYALAGLVLVILLFSLRLTVSSGTINGLVFYAQLMGATLTVVGNSLTRVFTVLISLVNLELGFPLCFYEGMNQAGKLGLQFVFPVYIWFLVLLFILAVQYSSRLQKIIGSNICVNVLVTLVYLSFAKIVRTITLILAPAIIQTGSGTHLAWYFDGSVNYFNGVHIFLALISFVFGILALIYVLGLLFLQWRGLRIGKLIFYLKPVIDAHSAPFKDKYRFWFGLRLLFVVIFIILTIFLAAIFQSLLLFLHFLMLFCLTLSQALLAPFKNRALNLLDLFFLTNICLYIGIQLFLQTFNNGKQLGDLALEDSLVAVEGVFVGSAVLVGLGIIGYHLLFITGFWKGTKKLFTKISKKQESPPHKVMTTEVTLSSTTSVSIVNQHQWRSSMLRESLLED